MRNVLAVMAGFLLWTILWLSSNNILMAALPDSFQPDGSPNSNGVLLLILFDSLLFSLAAGYLTAFVSERRGPSYALGVLNLAVGAAVQAGNWELLPIWYHLCFLALLVPGVVVGARFRLSSCRCRVR